MDKWSPVLITLVYVEWSAEVRRGVFFILRPINYIWFIWSGGMELRDMYRDRRWVGLPTSSARVRVRRQTLHRPVPQGFEPWTSGSEVQHSTPEPSSKPQWHRDENLGDHVKLT